MKTKMPKSVIILISTSVILLISCFAVVITDMDQQIPSNLDDLVLEQVLSIPICEKEHENIVDSDGPIVNNTDGNLVFALATPKKVYAMQTNDKGGIISEKCIVDYSQDMSEIEIRKVKICPSGDGVFVAWQTREEDTNKNAIFESICTQKVDLINFQLHFGSPTTIISTYTDLKGTDCYEYKDFNLIGLNDMIANGNGGVSFIIIQNGKPDIIIQNGQPVKQMVKAGIIIQNGRFNIIIQNGKAGIIIQNGKTIKSCKNSSTTVLMMNKNGKVYGDNLENIAPWNAASTFHNGSLYFAHPHKMGIQVAKIDSNGIKTESTFNIGNEIKNLRICPSGEKDEIYLAYEDDLHHIYLLRTDANQYSNSVLVANCELIGLINDGTDAIIVYKDEDGYNEELYAIRMDPDGNPKWSTKLDCNSLIPSNVEFLRDAKGLFLILEARDFNEETVDGRLIKDIYGFEYSILFLDPAGNSTKAELLSGRSFNIFNYAVYSNGSFYLKETNYNFVSCFTEQDGIYYFFGDESSDSHIKRINIAGYDMSINDKISELKTEKKHLEKRIKKLKKKIKKFQNKRAKVNKGSKKYRKLTRTVKKYKDQIKKLKIQRQEIKRALRNLKKQL